MGSWYRAYPAARFARRPAENGAEPEFAILVRIAVRTRNPTLTPFSVVRDDAPADGG